MDTPRTPSGRFATAALLLGLTSTAALAQSGATSPADAAMLRHTFAIERPAVLPHAVTSFGACRAGGWLYVYGGHIGRAHAHSRANVVGSFQRLNLADGISWQALPSGPALQGLALVASAAGTVYRVGGMQAHNDPDAPDDLHSTASVARFDPETNVWVETTPLPEPRSSHDAIVLDNRLYVVGGWNLAGGEEGTWHHTGYVADLREEPLVWAPLPDLGEERRAAALAAFAGRIVLLGGIGPEGLLDTVRVFDPSTSLWSNGPDLPGTAFGTAALGLGDRLFATVADGRLLAWDGIGPWQTVATLEMPRFFHRLVPALDAGQLLAIGGAGRGGHTRTLETIDTTPQPLATLRECVIPAPGRVTHRQAVFLRDNTLWAFGGNRGTSKDRFAKDQFAEDIWRIDLLEQTAARAGSLPAGRQSMAVATASDGGGPVLLGGLGVAPDGSVRSLASTWRWDARCRELRPFAELPAGLTQCAAVQLGDDVWVFGGTEFTPDGDGGGTSTESEDVLVCNLRAESPAFVFSGLRLPRPRRSFAAAVLGNEVILLGGLGGDFEHAGPADVLDVAAKTWRSLELPTPWVSPQAAVIGDRLYVACGGTMDGQKFTEDRSLWSWRRDEGWRRLVAELPFPVRHVHMLAQRNRLLFYSANDPRGERIVIRTLEPDPSVHVLETAMHR